MVSDIKVIPPSRSGEGRRRPRRGAQGLSLTCTAPSLFLSPRAKIANLAVELRDVGWGGVQFVSSEPLPTSCPLNLQLREESTGEVLFARGEVARSEKRTADGREIHLVAARFVEILTPPAKCARFFEIRRETAPAEAAPPPRRDADRFPIDDFEVTLVRDQRPGLFRKPANLALGLLDLSRTGAQIVCREALKPSEKVRLTVHLKKFKDTFVAEAQAVWVRFSTPHDGLAWRVGLAFGALGGAQKRLLESMESWFTYSRPVQNEARLHPSPKRRTPLSR